MKKTHGHRVDACRGEFRQPSAHLAIIERLDHSPLAVEALGYLEPAVTGYQGLRKFEEQIVNIVALLGTHLQDVAETRGGEQPHASAAFALDDGVGHQCGAMHDIVHLGQRDGRLGHQFLQTDQGRARGVVG